MIYGIGTDILEIERLEAVLARRGDAFVERILGPNERAIFERRRAKVARRGLSFLATRFAAKEALSKALGLGMRAPMSWLAAEILKAVWQADRGCRPQAFGLDATTPSGGAHHLDRRSALRRGFCCG
jgi:holo-[acyl-carrier-protein] synthase